MFAVFRFVSAAAAIVLVAASAAEAVVINVTSGTLHVRAYDGVSGASESDLAADVPLNTPV
ncbi:MAG: hypothetical protein AB7U20_23195, partial [Planctomycetaceae bacterium]